jgi:hypothetical protein
LDTDRQWTLVGKLMTDGPFGLRPQVRLTSCTCPLATALVIGKHLRETAFESNATPLPITLTVLTVLISVCTPELNDPLCGRR